MCLIPNCADNAEDMADVEEGESVDDTNEAELGQQ